MIAIRIENLSKQYHLGAINRQMLYQELQSRWARWRGHADPHAPIHARRVEGDGSFWALRNVSLDIEQGEVVGIIGRNGAGKSTLLKILSRITAPTEGRVCLRGRVSSLLEVGTGFHTELTGRENVYLNGAILGMSRAEIDRKFDEIVAFAGVDEFLDTPVKRYSSGMTVRLAFAVAAHLEPETLIIDEVLAVGDEAFQRKCLGKMDEVTQQEGRTLLFVSHNMAAVNSLCRKTIVMDDGRIAFAGPTVQAVAHYLRLIAHQEADRHANPLSFPEASSLPIQFSEVALVAPTTGQPALKFNFHEGLAIEMLLTVRAADRDYYTAVTIADPTGTWVIFTSDEDLEEPPIGRASPGRHRYRVVVPGGWLKPGTYSVSIAVCKRPTGRIDRYDGVFSFDIIDVDSRRALKNLYRKPALVAPEIPWSFNSAA